MSGYNGLSGDALEREYNPRRAVPDFQRFLDSQIARSAATRKALRCSLDVRYGDGPLQTLDVFPAADPRAPIHVFIHGGYWRGLDKSVYSFIAEPLVAAGATVVMLNYDLAPALAIGEIVEQTRQAVHWIYANGGALGGDPDRLYLSGHSAGGHLAAMMLAQDWAAQGLPGDVLKGVIAVSGVYDLEPVTLLAVNAEIGLTPDHAAATSLVAHPPLPICPVLVAVGGGETGDWIRQSLEFARLCRQRGLVTDYWEIGSENHFSICDRMGEAHHPLTRAMLAQMGL
ncbi:alpha/beta hydrolase [Oceanibaculum pacificum]|uniref:Alpha/beta hydrolase fold-3 domain-containing protein n=1 Tax=Oceanibaculum pacificum TaxID=580166 RepID=A0A154W7Z1_9PROT|nr:alpha/beta hydrolase [Oceanibaculum pacificum]KZD09659.1 hypothetical protein AUP43_06830 [Oceanibaculum pacificum]